MELWHSGRWAPLFLGFGLIYCVTSVPSGLSVSRAASLTAALEKLTPPDIAVQVHINHARRCQAQQEDGQYLLSVVQTC